MSNVYTREPRATRDRLRGLDPPEPDLCAEAIPCPHCGGEEIVMERIELARGGLYWLVCRACGACTRGQSSALAAIERWNTRWGGRSG